MTEHHDKIPAQKFPLYVLTARKVEGKERTLEGPKKALDKEWERLREIGAWDDKSVRELDDVLAEAQKSGETVHHGRGL